MLSMLGLAAASPLEDAVSPYDPDRDGLGSGILSMVLCSLLLHSSSKPQREFLRSLSLMGVSTAPEPTSDSMLEQSLAMRLCHSSGIKREDFLLREGQQLCTLWKRSRGTRLAIDTLLPDGLGSFPGTGRNVSVSKKPSTPK